MATTPIIRTIEFMQCDNNGITPFGFPPHTTHILQPLDVVVFQPYKHYDMKALDVAVRRTRFNKVEFVCLFLSRLLSLHPKGVCRLQEFQKTNEKRSRPLPKIST
jgi:hypothetical protein